MLAAGFALIAGAPIAAAQSVTGTGELSPAIPAPPLTNWNLGGGNLTIGDNGAGTLTIAGGGTVSDVRFGSIGGRAGSTGALTVTGAGSSWSNNAGYIYAGLGGAGTLTVENGGAVSTGYLYIGYAASGNGTVTVTGAGSNLTASTFIAVGFHGAGSLTVADGAVISGVASSGGDIGVSSSSNGTVTVTGAGSRWIDAGTLRIGLFGTGTLRVENGGVVESLYGQLGAGAGSNGTVIVTGAGSTWTNSNTLAVGHLGRGALTIAAGGKVSATVTTLATSAGSSGTLNLLGDAVNGRGVLETGQVRKGAGTATLNLDGGILRATGNQADYLQGFTALTIGAGGAVFDSNGFSIGVATNFSGTGGLTKTGTGMLILSGTSTYSGATTVSAGTLYINGAGAMSAASDYTVAAGALLDVNDGLGTVTAGSIAGAGQIRIEVGSTLEAGATNASTTFTGMIYDAGSLRKVGSGTLTLTQENTYSGGTTIAGGAISVSKESNLGATSGALTLNGGTLQVTGTTLTGLTRNIVFGAAGGGFDITEAGHTFTVTQSFSGTGAFSKAGAGTLVLSGTHSYSGATTVSGGTLRAGQAGSFSAASAFTVATGATLDLAGFSQNIGSLAGAGTVTLGAGTLTTGSDNRSTTFSGSISGGGALEKTGTGTLTLTGTNTYTGGTTVSGGKLVVNGSITGTVTLTGGSLGGSGSIGTVAVASGGTVSPGNSIGTLTITGNVSFAAGSTYQVEVNAAGQSDRIVVSGTATLTGGTVQVLAEDGNYAAATNYTILTASGGVSGQFATVTSNLAFLTPSLSYSGTSVTLTMTRNDTSFGPGGGDTSTGTGTTTPADTGATGRPYIASTRNQGGIAVAAEALGAGNPIYDAVLSATAEEARAGFDLLSGEAHAQGVAVMIGESRLIREAILGRLRGPLLTLAGGQVAASFSADLPGRKGTTLVTAPGLEPRYALWGEAIGGQSNTNADGNAAGLSRRTGGAIIGADLRLYDTGSSSLRVGVAGGYTQSRFDLDARLSSGRLESGHAALYAGGRFGAFRLDAGLSYSWGETDIRRQVQIRGFGDLLRSQRPGAVTQGFVELGYAITFQSVALEPFAQLALLRVSTEAGVEQGGAAALRLFSSDQTLGFTTLGLRAEAQILATPFFARGMLGWRHGFGELTPQALTAFASGTTPARVFAARIDREALTAEAGLDWRPNAATTLGLAYSAAIGERTRDHALKGKVEVRF